MDFKLLSKPHKGLHENLAVHNMQGFTIIQLVITLGLISLVVGLSSRVWVVSQRAEYSIEASKGYENIQDALFDAIQSAIRNGIVQNNPPCMSLASQFPNNSWLRPSTRNVSQVRSQRPSDIDDADWNQLFNSAFASGTGAAQSLNRCSQPSLGNNGRFHFCLELQRAPNAPRNSVRSSPFAYVEVTFQLLDFQSGQNINCQAYRQPARNTAGASVTYLLYWVNRLGNQLELRHQNGVFYVTKI